MATAKAKTTSKKVDTEVKAEKAIKAPTSAKLSKNIRKGTEVMVRTGKHAGKTGKVTKFDKVKMLVWVEQVNEALDYNRNVLAGGSGTKAFKSMPMPISKIKLVTK